MILATHVMTPKVTGIAAHLFNGLLDGHRWNGTSPDLEFAAFDDSFEKGVGDD